MSNTTSNPNNLKKKSKLLPYPLSAFLGLILLVALAYYLLHINPLPKDEELIAHFKAHRGEFEELVRRYRQYEPETRGMHHLWEKQGDTPELLKRAGVRWFSTAAGIWIPDPYEDGFEKRSNDLLDKYGMEWLDSKYSGLAITLEDHRYETVSLLFGNRISKTLLNFPEIPRIKESVLIGPGVDEKKQIDHPMFSRVLPSLNDYPPSLHKGYCVLRQIEPQWFIEMCRY